METPQIKVLKIGDIIRLRRFNFKITDSGKLVGLS